MPFLDVTNCLKLTDDERLIVNYEKDSVIIVTVHQSTRSVIPCKPTHPDVVMTLNIEGEDEASDHVIVLARCPFIFGFCLSSVRSGHCVSNNRIQTLSTGNLIPENQAAP